MADRDGNQAPNLPASFQLAGEGPEAGVVSSRIKRASDLALTTAAVRRRHHPTPPRVPSSSRSISVQRQTWRSTGGGQARRRNLTKSAQNRPSSSRSEQEKVADTEVEEAVAVAEDISYVTVGPMASEITPAANVRTRRKDIRMQQPLRT
uniref:Uncharacterized protein n=1 Tax=Pseudictyota dubia TaxID=2749911 RepID=A0A7R9WG56_9STRA|mmetsp:Transcript_47338/g.87929  ORF Transcript_47338/g.87929 Transcript_47338/m.87929 type:complete len:150 (+) Transcript_47338:498-947(+)